MKLQNVLYPLIGCILLTVVVISCKKDEVDPQNDFDRTALVKNIGNNLIMNSYHTLSSTVDAMDAAVATFNAAPTAVNLTDVQNKFKDAYEAWEHCAPFGFGPADQMTLDKNVNIFPTSADKINANISSGSYDLDQLTNLDAKGLPALDYLLFGTGADNDAILLKYTTDDGAAKRKDYLAALSADVKKLSDDVVTAWEPLGGNYLNTFLNATGTDIGSAIGQLINGVAYDLDLLKNYKVAIPVGIMPAAGTQTGDALPEKVEGYYSGISSQLVLADLTTLQDIYLGRNSGSDDSGLDDYLVSIGAQYNGGSLNDAINNQFAAAVAKVQALPDPLSNTIETNAADVKATYTELQKLLVLLKTDMPSALGVQITFEDTDGD